MPAQICPSFSILFRSHFIFSLIRTRLQSSNSPSGATRSSTTVTVTRLGHPRFFSHLTSALTLSPVEGTPVLYRHGYSNRTPSHLSYTRLLYRSWLLAQDTRASSLRTSYFRLDALTSRRHPGSIQAWLLDKDAPNTTVYLRHGNSLWTSAQFFIRRSQFLFGLPTRPMIGPEVHVRGAPLVHCV